MPPPPPPAASAEVNLSSLFADLKKFENNGDFERALKTAEKVLDSDPENIKAIKCKIVCLIQLNEFEKALDLIQAQAEELRDQLRLEKSYCQYRLNNVEESLKCLQKVVATDGDVDFSINELKAQTLYRIENFKDCYSLYVDLIKNSNDDFEDERFVNLVAVIVGLKHLNVDFKYDLATVTDSTYEVVYNKACALIATQNYEDAIKKLQDAEVACRKFLEEEGTPEEEIESELAIIRVQTAFCMQKLEQNDQALKLYNKILKQKLSDPALIAVVSNNIVAIHKDQNLFDSKKKIKMALSENAESKLSSNQKRNIHFNYCLFLINTNQYDACHKHLAVFRSKFPKFENDSVLIESYLYISEKKIPLAIETLKNFCLNNKQSNVDLETALMLVQLLLKEEDWANSAKVLETLNNATKYKLAVVSILLKIYEKTAQNDAWEKLLNDCIMWHENNDDPGSKKILTILYQEAAKFYLNQNKPQISVKHLEKNIKLKGKNPKMISMLINAYTLFDPAKAQSLQKELPSIEQILNSVDIEQLENKNWSLGVKYVKKAKDTPKTGVAASAAEKPKCKTKRKKILPKNYNPDEKPDPERWLPKYERSNYRKKKDKKAVGKGTQGAVGDMPEIKPSPKPVTSPLGPRQQRPTQKKKKKVGRK